MVGYARLILLCLEAMMVIRLSSIAIAFSLMCLGVFALDTLVALGDRQPAAISGDGSGSTVSLVNLDPFYFTMYYCAASRYSEANGRLPESQSDLRSFLFVQPRLKLDEWRVEGDSLTFGSTLRELDGSTRHAEPTIYQRGTATWDKFMEGGKRSMLSSLRERKEKGLNANWTEEDIREGRWSNYIWDSVRAHSKNAADCEQLMWSHDLAGILSMGAHSYEGANGIFPGTPQELVAFLGPVNEEAWVAPATGNPVSFVDEYDGENVCYKPSPDLEHFELIVPLFGAGLEQRGQPRGPEWGPRSGYYAGNYFMYTDEMMLSYPPL